MKIQFVPRILRETLCSLKTIFSTKGSANCIFTSSHIQYELRKYLTIRFKSEKSTTVISHSSTHILNINSKSILRKRATGSNGKIRLLDHHHHVFFLRERIAIYYWLNGEMETMRWPDGKSEICSSRHPRGSSPESLVSTNTTRKNITEDFEGVLYSIV